MKPAYFKVAVQNMQRAEAKLAEQAEQKAASMSDVACDDCRRSTSGKCWAHSGPGPGVAAMMEVHRRPQPDPVVELLRQILEQLVLIDGRLMTLEQQAEEHP